MLSPGLSMLWETVDAERALRERFGLGGRADATRLLTAVLAEHWGLSVQVLPRLTLSDHNAIAWVSSDHGPLVVKVSSAQDRFAQLAASTRLLTELSTRGIPVPAPLPSRDGPVRLEVDGPSGPLSLAVLPEIPGDWLDVSDLPAVHAAGACLATLHDALGDIRTQGLPDHAPRPLPDRLWGWLSDRDPGRVPAASDRLAELLTGLPAPEDAPQLIHGDFRAANLLVRDSGIAAVLDFDDVRLDHRIADLAQAGTYLATRFRGWGPTPLPARAALRAGYETVRPLGPLGSRWFETLSLWMGIAAIPPQDDGRWTTAVDALIRV
ncbi:aminoglycoside phosphotransferase [Brachybacterium vulturis]|uniref:Aminoglycoside phosphotransferase n=1 Tax=Brachybacterium vulturis TaxID=2017484 RepID=A0A291GJC1_9MICO|nr:phosphotransferase [Brachybacterium vulturis]ATG50613.1 aminoglycoside phosphotransferase [Brachybacterium vulturis]